MHHLHEEVDGLVVGGLMEASLGRIWQHNRDRAFAILTAWRGDRDLAANKAAFSKLKKTIRAAGYGFIPMEGVGQEKKGGKLVASSEPSLLVPSKQKGDDPKLGKLALKWAKQHEQDYIFFHTIKDGKPVSDVVHVGSGSVEMKLTKFKPAEIGTFYSKLRSGRTFKYEAVGVKYADPPSNWIHGMGRESEGEIFTHCETLDEWRETMRAIR